MTHEAGRLATCQVFLVGRDERYFPQGACYMLMISTCLSLVLCDGATTIMSLLIDTIWPLAHPVPFLQLFVPFMTIRVF